MDDAGGSRERLIKGKKGRKDGCMERERVGEADERQQEQEEGEMYTRWRGGAEA